MFDWVDSSGSDNGSSMQGFGHYHEHYRKGDDGQWRIAELRLTRLRVDSSPPTGAVTKSRRGPGFTPSLSSATLDAGGGQRFSTSHRRERMRHLPSPARTRSSV